MKKIKQLFFTLFFMTTIISCGGSSSIEDDFEEVNNNVVEKLIKRIEISFPSNSSENATILINYDGNNRVSSISDGSSTKFFNYDSSGNLALFSDNYDSFKISDLYQAPYDVFDNGDVLLYDSKGNPSKIQVVDGGSVLTGDVTYDSKPNPFFYTLKAAKIIDVLDQVQLNFGVNSPSIVKARKLLPNNSITGIIFKDSSNKTVAETQFDYVYDADGYPTSASVFYLNSNETYRININYFYK